MTVYFLFSLEAVTAVVSEMKEGGGLQELKKKGNKSYADEKVSQ